MFIKVWLDVKDLRDTEIWMFVWFFVNRVTKVWGDDLRSNVQLVVPRLRFAPMLPACPAVSVLSVSPFGDWIEVSFGLREPSGSRHVPRVRALLFQKCLHEPKLHAYRSHFEALFSVEPNLRTPILC